MPEWVPEWVTVDNFLRVLFIFAAIYLLPVVKAARDSWRSLAEGRKEELKYEKEKHEKEMTALKDGTEKLVLRIAERTMEKTVDLTNQQWVILYNDFVKLSFPLIVKSYGIEKTKKFVSEFDYKSSQLKDSLLWGLNLLERELSAP